MKLISLAMAPIFICCFYMYIRDKYEHEPIRLLLVGLTFGVLIGVPILKVEKLIISFMPIGGQNFDAFYNAFIVASFSEEIFKFIVLYLLVWKNRNFNEPVDGIVYSVFISLGFAGIENLLYVTNPTLGGLETGLLRAVLSVPAHGFFGVNMGYYFALAKFTDNKKFIVTALLSPFIIHGLYDFILLSSLFYLIIPFWVFIIFLWYSGLRKIKLHLENSPFKYY